MLKDYMFNQLQLFTSNDINSFSNFDQNFGSDNSVVSGLCGNVTPFKILTATGKINLYTYKPDSSGTFLTGKG